MENPETWNRGRRTYNSTPLLTGTLLDRRSNASTHDEDTIWHHKPRTPLLFMHGAMDWSRRDRRRRQPAAGRASESVAVRGAEAAAAEAAAPAAGEPLGPADVGAVGPAEAGAPEPVALRLARPRLRHRHRPDLCSTQQHLRQIIISRLPPAAS
jgi:hypothetical protein